MNESRPVVKNYRSFLMTVFLLATSLLMHAQQFEAAGISFAGAGRSAVAWADYDNDHDLDLLVSGIGADDMPVTVLYRNDNGDFSDSGIEFTPVKESSACWGDYDQDGDQDLLLCGNSMTGDVTRIYRNDEGTFTEIDPGLPAIQNGESIWADVDSDGDLDIFITGNWIAALYLNQEGSFTGMGQSFGYFSSSSAAFGDYDNDGDLDLLIIGDSGAGAVSKIFRNDDGSFIDVGAGLSGLMSGTTSWVDYDNDGDLDVAISGFDDALEAQFFLYKNDGKQFTPVYSGIEGFALGGADWADFDLDGDIDLVTSGKATGCGAYVSGIYRNDGNDVFYKLSDAISTATRCALGWADFENDGDPDFIIAGLNTLEVPFTKLYLNTAGDNQFKPNSPPSSPVYFASEVTGNEALLSWTGAIDPETSFPGLNYNLMLSSSLGGCEIISPMSIYPEGTRMITGIGNAGQIESLRVGSLMPGTYYWSVQAIDQAYEGSEFSAQQTFTITATGIEDILKNMELSIYPNPSSDVIFIEIPELPGPSVIMILDSHGKVVYTSEMQEYKLQLDISSFSPGLYLVRWATGNNVRTSRFSRY